MLAVYEKIKQAKKVIILTHVQPDMDALGSQFGLKQLINDNLPNIDVYTSGQQNSYPFVYPLDNLADEMFIGATVVVVDTGNKERISDQRYHLGDTVLKIDHHIDTAPFGDVIYVDDSSISTCSILTKFAKEQGLIVTKKTAEWWFAGIVQDSGRFLYDKTNAETFELTSFLLERQIDINDIYERLYRETERSKRLQGYVLTHFILDESVAYMKFPKEYSESHGRDFSELKSGIINLMSNIEGVHAWATFTEYGDRIYVEMRGTIPIVDVAIRHGGGGHSLACGTAVNSWDEVDTIIKELKEVPNEPHTKNN